MQEKDKCIYTAILRSKARETCPRGKVRESPVERHTEKL
jgi:hypothetical protein